jgi:hypothetical protein
MRHHPCDRRLEIGGKLYTLRFSLRSLALIALRLGANGPQAIARIMSEPRLEIRLETARVLLSCFLLNADLPNVTQTELAKAMTLMADMIEEAFHED